MVRLKDLQGNYYYVTEAIIPPAFQRGDELNDVIKFVRVVKDGWIICFSDRFLTRPGHRCKCHIKRLCRNTNWILFRWKLVAYHRRGNSRKLSVWICHRMETTT